MVMARATNDMTIFFVCKCGQLETDAGAIHFGVDHPIIGYCEKYGEIDPIRMAGVRRWAHERALQYREQENALAQVEARKNYQPWVTDTGIGSARMLGMLLGWGSVMLIAAGVVWLIWKVIL